MNLSLRNKIIGSFLILVMVFVVNAIITIITLNTNKRLSNHISTVIDPLQQDLATFEEMLILSKMYSTNWAFLRANQEDKEALNNLQTVGYPVLKLKLYSLFIQSHDQRMTDSLNNIFIGFEKLISIERTMMQSLQKFADYDDPVKKLQAEQIIEDQIIPNTTQLINALDKIAAHEHEVKIKQYSALESYSIRLRILISVLAISIAALGIMLSIYFVRIITIPINEIEEIIRDLGKGIIKKAAHKESMDEIGRMTRAVNALSDKIDETTIFAENIGNRKFNVNYSPLSNEDKLGKALIAMRDNLKISEEILLSTNDDLHKTNMELDKFVYSVSHDLRAPLSSMLGVIGFLESDISDLQTLQDIEFLKNNVHKLDSFILDILDYSRNTRLEVKNEEIHFKELLDETINNLKFMSSGNDRTAIRIHVNDNTKFCSDKMRLRVILNNLISNSIRYSNPKIANPFVEILVNLSVTEANIIIKDNGIGIPNEYLQKIFEIFFRVSANSDGSGLGLYIVKETVEKLNGIIQIESKLGEGSTFNISIPNLVNL